jgi:serine/threonine protein kinase
VVFDGELHGTAVAIKAIPLQASHEYELDKFRREVDRIKSEINILWELRQPNILNLFGACFDEVETAGKVCLVTELCKGSMLRYITGRGRGEDMPVLNDELIYQFMEEVLAALCFMHARGIIHRDLKPDNILISMDNHAKIADFGLSKQTGESMMGHTANIGSPAYMAPECLGYSGDGPLGYTCAVDVYSFGIILNSLWRRALPYKRSDFGTVLELLRAVEEGWRPPSPLGCPRFVGNLMSWSWHAIPEERISASNALGYLKMRGNTAGLRSSHAEIASNLGVAITSSAPWEQESDRATSGDDAVGLYDSVDSLYPASPDTTSGGTTESQVPAANYATYSSSDSTTESQVPVSSLASEAVISSDGEPPDVTTAGVAGGLVRVIERSAGGTLRVQGELASESEV